MFNNFLSNFQVRSVSAWASAQATTALNSSIVDMSGFDGVTFILNRGASHSTGRPFKVQHMDSSTGLNAADLAGSAVTSKHKDSLAAVEIVRPQKRWLRAVVGTGPAMALGSIIAIQSNGRSRPTDNASDADAGIAVTILHSPSSGTA